LNKDKIKIENTPLMYFESIDSTNSYAREAVFDYDALILSEMQTKGRGRVGHTFYSPKGGIYFSYVFKDDRVLEDLTLEVGKIVLKNIKKYCNKKDIDNLSIHGVNDIFLGEKKVCGILCEHILDRYIVGIGINSKECVFPDDIKSIAGSISLVNHEDLITSLIGDIKEYINNL